jgi:hypothetical protein
MVDFPAGDTKLGVMCGMSLAAAAAAPAPQRGPRVRPQRHFLCVDGGNGCLVGLYKLNAVGPPIA